MRQSTFLPRNRIVHLFCKSTAIICQKTWSALFKNYLLWHSGNGFLTIIRDHMPGGRLPETENKWIYQISGPTSGGGRFGSLRSGRLRESFGNSVWLRNKRIICKVVAYGRWSLTRSWEVELWESWLYNLDGPMSRRVAAYSEVILIWFYFLVIPNY